VLKLKGTYSVDPMLPMKLRMLVHTLVMLVSLFTLRFETFCGASLTSSPSIHYSETAILIASKISEHFDKDTRSGSTVTTIRSDFLSKSVFLKNANDFTATAHINQYYKLPQNWSARKIACSTATDFQVRTTANKYKDTSSSSNKQVSNSSSSFQKFRVNYLLVFAAVMLADGLQGEFNVSRLLMRKSSM